MILSLSYQATLFLSTIAIGGILGFLYDIFRILRITFPHPNFLIQLEDAVYWVLVVLTMFLFMLHKNYGEIRFFSVCGAFLGMLLYFFTLSLLVMAISGAVVSAIKWLLRLFLEILWTPFSLLLKVFRRPAKKMQQFASKKSKKMLHLFHVYGKMKKARYKQRLRILLKKH